MASDTLRHATIIAGGIGSRAHGMTGDRIPKALLPVAGVPIIFRQLEVLAREGIKAVTVLAGHLGDQLVPPLAGEAARLGIAVDVVVEKEPLGTAGCLSALGRLPHDTLIVYGDMLFDMDLARLARFHAAQGAIVTVVAHPNDHPETSDLLVEQDGLVRAILPAKAPRQGDFRNLVPAGLYLAGPQFLSRMAPGLKADMIHDILPALLAESAGQSHPRAQSALAGESPVAGPRASVGRGGQIIAAYNTPEYLRDVGTQARHALAEADIASGRVERESLRFSRPAIFFDIDGTLAREPGGHGVLSPDQVELLPGAALALKAVQAAGYLAVAVTNRPQLAKGLLDRDGLERIFGRLETLLARDKAWLNRIYFCPHHPEAGHRGEVAALKIDCRCRKPGPGMLEEAVCDLNIDLRGSALIGDSLRDMGAARAMEIQAIGVRTGYGCGDGDRYPGAMPRPDRLFDTVLEATNFLIAQPAADSTP